MLSMLVFEKWRMIVKACVELSVHENGDYVQGVLTYTHTLTIEWMNEVRICD